MRSARPPAPVLPTLERLEPRHMPAGGLVAAVSAGAIRGSVFIDRNGNGQRDPGEPGMAGVVVYLDDNRDGRPGPGERSQRSGADGSYAFSGLGPGNYLVAEVAPPGWAPATTPRPAPVGLASPATVVPSAADHLIGLDRFRADPRFAGIDGSGTSVVVIDTGIDAKNAAFGADAVAYQKDFVSGAAAAGDDVGHGTEMASLIASRAPAHPGVAPGARLIVLKVFGADGGSFTTIKQALSWVVENGARYHVACVNLSLADSGTYDRPVRLDGIDGELAALVAEGIPVVAAAGNAYHGKGALPGLAYPAADPSVLPVGAVWDRDRGGGWTWSADTTDFATGPDRIASFSQRLPGSGELFAPGTELAAASPWGWTTVSGTSAASAVVSGVVALAEQLAASTLHRALTPAEVRYLLLRTGKTILDGDDETDSVAHTRAAFARIDVEAVAEAVLAMAPGVRAGPRPGSVLVHLTAGQAVAGADLGVACPNHLAGQAFRDGNGDGSPGPGGAALGAFTVYADANGNGRLDPGETRTVTDGAGRFDLVNLDPGVYDVRLVVPPGWQATAGVRVVVAAGLVRTDLRLGARFLAVNHAPIGLRPARLTAQPAGRTDPPGDRVGDLLAGAAFDADPGTRFGMALLGVGGPGRWEVSRDGGRSWGDPVNLPAGSARLLADTDRLRFVPSGPAPCRPWIRYRVWDQSTGRGGDLVRLPFGDNDNLGPASAFGSEVEKATLNVG